MDSLDISLLLGTNLNRYGESRASAFLDNSCEWCIVDCVKEYRIDDTKIYAEGIPLRYFADSGVYGGYYKYSAYALLLVSGNQKTANRGGHFVCALRTTNNIYRPGKDNEDFVVIDDLHPGDPQPFRDYVDHYQVVNVLLVNPQYAKPKKVPDVCINKDNRCIISACISFLTAIPQQDLDAMSAVMGMTDKRFPLTSAVLHTAFGTNKVSEKSTQDVHRYFLGLHHNVDTTLFDSEDCVSTFLEEYKQIVALHPDYFASVNMANEAGEVFELAPNQIASFVLRPQSTHMYVDKT